MMPTGGRIAPSVCVCDFWMLLFDSLKNRFSLMKKVYLLDVWVVICVCVCCCIPLFVAYARFKAGFDTSINRSVNNARTRRTTLGAISCVCALLAVLHVRKNVWVNVFGLFYTLRSSPFRVGESAITFEQRSFLYENDNLKFVTVHPQ